MRKPWETHRNQIFLAHSEHTLENRAQPLPCWKIYVLRAAC